MTFKRRHVTFGLEDIGSQVIDQISSDIYSGPGSIIREIVKNAYDAYLKIDPLELEEEGIARSIQISRRRDGLTGFLYISENGIGQSFDKLRENVQISISTKPVDLVDAMGFRGLGSWAVLGAGSRITITSKMKGEVTRSRLEFDVRAIYEKMSVDTNLDEILNNSKCIAFSAEDYKESKDEHFTTVEIECDGSTEKVNGYELNRLFSFTDDKDGDLRRTLAETCPIPFSSEGGAYKDIHSVYSRARYIPTQIILDGKPLERRVPTELSEFNTHEIMLAGKLAAIAWFVEDPKDTGVRSIDADKYLVAGPGIQLVKLNVPIGPKNIFNDGEARENLLNWYVGEVHIVMSDVLPNASGQDLRAGTTRDIFIEELRKFYKMLDSRADTKSVRINLEKHLKRAKEGAEKLTDTGLDAKDKHGAEAAVIKGVEVLEQIDAALKSKNEKNQKVRDALAEPHIKDLRDATRKILKKSGHFDTYAISSSKQSKKTATQPKSTTSRKPALDSDTPARETFQARVATYLPRLEALGLAPEQVTGVLAIIEELFVSGVNGF